VTKSHDVLTRFDPYLFPTPEARARWAPMFADRAPLHVGLSWAAAKHHHSGPHRSLTLANLAPLFDVPGTKFYSLQYGASDEVAKYPRIHDLGNIDRPQARFMETIGVLASLDLLIACDSSVGHLAGAVGTPTFLLLPFAYDPRWGARRFTTKWYPLTTLFQCKAPGAKNVVRSQRKGLDEDPWPEVVEEVKATLEAVRDNRSLLRA